MGEVIKGRSEEPGAKRFLDAHGACAFPLPYNRAAIALGPDRDDPGHGIPSKHPLINSESGYRVRWRRHMWLHCSPGVALRAERLF